MDLRTRCIFWADREAHRPAYPQLDRDLRCDVAIIGGGITGALSAYFLSKAGVNVIVLDRRAICAGSTPASTGLLQDEIDTPLTALAAKIGKDHAQRAYRLSIDSLDAFERSVQLRTRDGAVVQASRVIFATGYETPEFLDQNFCTLKSTYALASVPTDLTAWPDRCLIWESDTPYFYARTTSDGRAIVGGEDEDFTDAKKRDALIAAKCRAMTKAFEELMPAIPIRPACCWAGTFAETKDGLPYIGTNRQFPLGCFALGYGGNGITFSLIAAEIIRDLITSHANENAELFRLDR